MEIIFNSAERAMRTPVGLLAGQGDTDAVTGTLLRRAGTPVVERRFDGHVLRRTMTSLQHGLLVTAEAAPELAHGGVCPVQTVEFGARRPFHSQRLHAAIDVLLEGVIRTRGRWPI